MSRRPSPASSPVHTVRAPTASNTPGAVTAADFKPAQLRLTARLGLAIPPTLVTNDVEQTRKFAAGHGRIIYKTFRGLPRDEDGHTGAIRAQGDTLFRRSAGPAASTVSRRPASAGSRVRGTGTS